MTEAENPRPAATAPARAAEGGAARKSERTREEILAAAARLFRRRGVDAATLRHIASEARLEAGSIYYHFASKEEIVDAVLDRGLRDIHEGVGAVLAERRAAGAPFRETFAAAVGAHLAYLHALGDFTSTNIRNFSQLPQAARQRHRPLRRDYAAMWDAMLEEARDRGEIRAELPPAALRRFVLGALNWTVEWFDPARSPLEDLSSRISEMMLDGISSDAWRGAPIGDASDAFPPPDPAEGPAEAPADPPRAKSERTREAILRSAARLIRDRGYTAATLRAIAAEAQVEAGSIYYHFGSKTQILDEVLDRGLRGMRDGLAAAMTRPFRDGADRRARIAGATRAHLDHLLAMGEFTSANIRNYGRLPAESRRRNRPVRAEYSALWEALLEGARRDGVLRPDIEVASLRQVVLGALNWTVEWFDGEPRPGFLQPDAYAEMCVGVILDGIAAPEAPEPPETPGPGAGRAAGAAADRPAG